ncbi:MAG: hypothetical protein U0I22_08510 [Treponema sp.]|nr:hypothetical protein [Treponema sp.]
MTKGNFSGIILQPHNTPLSQMLRQHREILKALSLAGKKSKIYPIHPCHCLVDSVVPAKELKKQMKSCRVFPPQIQEGFLFRPVEVTGTRLLPFPPQLLHQLLPFLSEKDLQNRSIPAGFIFGYVNLHPEEASIQQELESISNEIKPLDLRVFRLHHIEYCWRTNSLPSSLCWTMELPHWVKTPHQKNTTPPKQL